MVRVEGVMAVVVVMEEVGDLSEVEPVEGGSAMLPQKFPTFTLGQKWAPRRGAVPGFLPVYDGARTRRRRRTRGGGGRFN